MIHNIEDLRAYVVHMISEHRQLEETVRTIEQRWHVLAMEASDDTITDLMTSLQQLRDELRRHFQEEESGGCIEEAVAWCPSLSVAAARLEHEHPALLEHLDRVIEQLGQVRVETGLANVAHHDFQDFVTHLRSHETSENEILEQGFGIE